MEQQQLFVLELPLKVEIWQADILNVRYELMRKMYNDARRILSHHFHYHVEKRKEFRSCKTNEEKSKFLKSHPFHIKGITDKQNNPMEITFSKYGIGGFVAQLVKQNVGAGKTYKDFGINSSYADCVASNLWSAWEKRLFDNKCKRVAFKRKGEFNTISVREKNGYFTGFTLSIDKKVINININGKTGSKSQTITLPIEYNSEYEKTALKNNDIRVISIVRKVIRGKYKYYLQLTINGSIPTKGRTLGQGKVGIDIGPSTIAIASNTKVCISKLASECDNIEKIVGKLQRKMDRSRRTTNPQNFTEEGNIKRIIRAKGERRIWHVSNRYIRLQKSKAELQRKQAAIRRRSHILKANELLSLGNTFIVENNPIKQWSTRAKETKISEKTGKYQRKSRYGHSIANHAPSMFITILTNKVHALGGKIFEVDLKNAASRYDFTNGEFSEHKLNERTVTLSNGNKHQRDIISAFNLQHIDLLSTQVKQYDTKQMWSDYPFFCELEKTEIQRHLEHENNLSKSTIGTTINLKEVLSSLADAKSMPMGGWSANANGIETGKKARVHVVYESNDLVSGVQKASNLHYNKDDT